MKHAGKFSSTVLSVFFIAVTAFADDRDDYLQIAKRASVDVTQGVYLRDVDAIKTLVMMAKLSDEQARMSDIQKRQSNELGLAAQDVRLALPRLYNIYLTLKAESFEALPIALLSELLAQSVMARDMQAYQVQSQAGARRLMAWLRSRQRTVVESPSIECSLRGKTLTFRNLTDVNLRDCLLSVTAYDVMGKSSTVIAFVENWSRSSTADVWSGVICDYDAMTRLEFQAASPDSVFAKIEFKFPDRIESACDSLVRKAEALVERDEFAAAIDLMKEVRAVAKTHNVSKFDLRLDKAESTSRLGIPLILRRTEVADWLLRHTDFSGTYKRDKEKDVAVLCKVVKVDRETGDVNLSFLAKRGNETVTFPGYGRIDIDPNNQTLDIKITKKGNSDTVNKIVFNVGTDRKGLIGRDESGGKIRLSLKR